MAEVSASLEGFAFCVAFSVVLPCSVRGFRYWRMGFAFEADAAVEFDLRLKSFMRFAEVMPASGDGQGGADYPGFLEYRFQLPAYIVGVLGDGLPISCGYGVLLVAIVGGSCGSGKRCNA